MKLQYLDQFFIVVALYAQLPAVNDRVTDAIDIVLIRNYR